MSSIDGEWTGIYDYPGLALDATPFRAKISSVETGFCGEISEPHLEGGDTIFADIFGSVSGRQVYFKKTYDQVDNEYPTVSYEGTINEDFSKIEGKWTTHEETPWSGPFVMNKAKPETLKESIKESLSLNL